MAVFSETKISITMRNLKIEKSAFSTLILEFWSQSIYKVHFSRFQQWPPLLYSNSVLLSSHNSSCSPCLTQNWQNFFNLKKLAKFIFFRCECQLAAGGLIYRTKSFKWNFLFFGPKVKFYEYNVFLLRISWQTVSEVETHVDGLLY